MIPVFRPSTGQAEADAVAEVLKSGWIGQGPKTAEFEQAFASYLGVAHSVGMNSATAALHLAMMIAGVRPGDEVIVPTITFVSTAHVVLHNGGTVVFADVVPDTLNISFADVAAKITPKTKAIVPVHYAGRPVDVRALKRLVGEKIAIIEDCAHACGANYYGRKVGAEGNLSCFSFHAVKNLAMGDGGALIGRDDDDYARAKRLRWLGIDKDTWTRSDANRQYWWQYNVTEIGFKCHLNDIAAAVGLVQLKKLDAMNARRREIVALYDELLSGVVETPPRDSDQFRSAWHIYCVRCDRRDDLAVHLQTKGISTGVHYHPIHLYEPCYGRQPSLPVAEKQIKRIMSLPIFPDLSDDDVAHIAGEIRRFYA